MKTTDNVKIGDDDVTFTWYPKKLISYLKPFQIYGFCLNDEGKVCLVKDEGEERYTLPGGRVDPGESAEEALVRECQEEAQFTPKNINLIGSLEVLVVDKNGKTKDRHQQVRYICNTGEYGDFIPKKDGWETVERIFVEPKRLPDYVDWLSYPTGKAQYEDFLKYLDK